MEMTLEELKEYLNTLTDNVILVIEVKEAEQND